MKIMYLKKKISKIRVTKYGSLFQDKIIQKVTETISEFFSS